MQRARDYTHSHGCSKVRIANHRGNPCTVCTLQGHLRLASKSTALPSTPQMSLVKQPSGPLLVVRYCSLLSLTLTEKCKI